MKLKKKCISAETTPYVETYILLYSWLQQLFQYTTCLPTPTATATPPLHFVVLSRKLLFLF